MSGMSINTIATQQMSMQMIQMNSQAIATGQQPSNEKPAETSQAEVLQAAVNGLEQGSDNIADMSNMLATADGTASAINDSLGRIEELTLMSQNPMVGVDEAKIIQNEIDQLTEGINQMVEISQFNTKPLLDGSANDLSIATSSNQVDNVISLGDLTSSGLGVDQVDVTDPNAFESNLNAVHDAQDKVNSTRSDIGVSMNTLGYSSNTNSITALNLANTKSRMVDTDMAKATSEKEKNELLYNYSIQMQKQQMDQETSSAQDLFL